MTTTDKKYSVLFVDDEKRILTALRSIFRREYDVHIANGGQEALAILATHEINVIVSDQRMPGMLGNELLAQVYKLYPKTMRVLLTGFMDKEAIVKTINEGEIYRFINKPWRNEDIHRIIAEAALASEFEVEAQAAKPTNSEQSPSASQLIGETYADSGILMMGNSQELRNQIRQLCRQQAINVYGTQTIPQALGVASARSTIGVSIIDLPVNTNEAMQMINLLKEKRPELISIVLADETDAETAVELINSGQAFRYLSKPIESDKLEMVIAQAFTRHDALKTNTEALQRFKVAKSSRTISSSLTQLFSSFGRKRNSS